jgi:hypothetical protein
MQWMALKIWLIKLKTLQSKAADDISDACDDVTDGNCFGKMPIKKAPVYRGLFYCLKVIMLCISYS